MLRSSVKDFNLSLKWRLSLLRQINCVLLEWVNVDAHLRQLKLIFHPYPGKTFPNFACIMSMGNDLLFIFTPFLLEVVLLVTKYLAEVFTFTFTITLIISLGVKVQRLDLISTCWIERSVVKNLVCLGSHSYLLVVREHAVLAQSRIECLIIKYRSLFCLLLHPILLRNVFVIKLSTNQRAWTIRAQYDLSSVWLKWISWVIVVSFVLLTFLTVVRFRKRIH